ncbi:NFX1-type zinc finger-containing protein 1-like isoform X2 [Acanthaster planci]|nr:NFX1-type zinc finger-containing protein 1-like isoform X2 [Acanthaster planci]
MEKPPPNNFRDIPIFPESREIRQVTRPFLRKNIIKGKYESVEHYLDVQFRLLREDFVAPLREGVTEFLTDTTGRPQDIRIYQNVVVQNRTMGENGFIYTLNFDVRPLKRVRWEASKRLLYGSFVCLTKDKFHHIICATVENRKPADLAQGLVDVCFLTDIAPTKGPFIMAESAAYFEAYRHVLQGLQQMNEKRFSFRRYIVDVASSVDPPAYLRDFSDTTYDFALLAQKDFLSRWKLSHIRVLFPECWPLAEDLNLDESQKAALHTALTKEFAIIQGPPGTGKTYIGLKIIQLLLLNDSWKINLDYSPILVVCYTNHALDQFLEGIIAFREQNVVRVGSRSSSEILESKNLSHLRKERPRKEVSQSDKRALRETDEEIQICLAKLDIPNKALIHIDSLKEYMTRGEYFALSRRRHRGEPQEEEAEKLLHWLNVVDVEDERDWALPSNQKQQESMERINVEYEGYRIQCDRQIDDFDGRRQTREERRQKLKYETFSEHAAYPLESIKRCGKNHTILPHVELRKPDVMTDEEASSVERVWTLKIWDRWRLYRLWVQRYIKDHESKLGEHRKRYEEIAKRVQDVHIQEDLEILQKANVVGMTTTGAAKFRAVLQRLRPGIVVVEEAAEVLEAHIITTLTAACQHLILIGDHQQLKPNPTVYRLARQFNLDTSLFERMINNGVPCNTLSHQHRMRPEISSLMKKHFYNNLHDDESVLKMDDVKGVKHNMFFIDHRCLEDEDDDDRSKSNQYEAEVLVELCKYLLRQGYQHSQITILTTYTGQLFCFRRLMDKATFEGVRVCVVDNFQGEENDIILLSLVRSNEEGSIGFLRTSNRVCVALSRARMGFYCIGNASILKKAEIWAKIVATLEDENQIGFSLPLVCQNHPDKITPVATADDFKTKVPCGGCDGPCEYRLPCGHVCASLCHPDHSNHAEYKCCKPCTMKCDRGEHPCPLLCHEQCSPCTNVVQKTMPGCGHVIQIFCHRLDDVTCIKPCDKTFTDCGHLCGRKCGDICPHQKCPMPCKNTQSCEHHCTKPCGQSCEVFCQVRVTRTLSKCHHQVLMRCGERPENILCRTQITKTLPICGHQAQMRCFEDPSGSECSQRCEKILKCGHQCPNICGKPCELSAIGLTDFEIFKKCSKPCEKILVCGHRCPKICSEPCPLEKNEVALMSPSRSAKAFSEFCREKCRKKLACGHLCPNKCGEPCPGPQMDHRRYPSNIWTKCQERVQKKLPHCNHSVNVRCETDVSTFMCHRSCEKTLPCGHKCPNKCSEPCAGLFIPVVPHGSTQQGKQTPRARCEVDSTKALACGHSTRRMPCWKAERAAKMPCREPCRDELVCGHKCAGTCHDCNQGTLHKPCAKVCNKQLICGHYCKSVCGSVCSPDCTKCNEDLMQGTSQPLAASPPCKHNFTHHQLKTNACVRPCDQLLQCSHPCIGVCGDPCPPFCNVCDKKSVRTSLPRGRSRLRDVYIYLPDCKHLCEMRSLDKMFVAIKNDLEGGYFQIRSVSCPRCQQPIRHCPRYQDVLKAVSDLVERVRRRCLIIRRHVFGVGSPDVQRCTLLASPGMSFEVGRWMRCHNGHVFHQNRGDDDKHSGQPKEPLCPHCSHE